MRATEQTDRGWPREGWRLRSRATGLLLVIACAGACTASGDMGLTVARDSSGIRILESRAPLWSPGEEWRVVEPPRVEIGVDQGDEAYQLFDVKQALRMSDGSVVVLNGGTDELRWYDASGRHRLTTGGRGGGPGEFNVLEFMAVLPGDSILAYERVPPRASIFGPTGVFVRNLSVPRPANRSVWGIEFNISGALSGRRLVVWSQPLYGRGYHEDFTDGINRLAHPIGIVDLEAQRFDSVAAAPGWDVWIDREGSGAPRMAAPPFARSSDIVGDGAAIYIAPTDDVSILVLDAAGRLRRIIRAAHSPVPISRADWDAWIAELYEQFPEVTPGQRAQGERLLAAMPVPERMPAYRGLDVDRDGNLWLHDYPRPGLANPGARVFDADGRWLGTVTLPAGIRRELSREPRPMDIGDDFILGVWTDSLGVEYVRLYQLAKPR
ncbi:MAG: hypothetical protein L0271_12785 [Gemmatimonadetes bacterium]|nr:hypothetical protein [Gemmatimonadota bacterium]